MQARRIVVTGGPGAGKTASLEMARQVLCDHVGFARESASIVFGGGFPRDPREPARRAAQRAIFHVQRELETMYDEMPGLQLLVCDRGTIDGVAYWPGREDEFFTQLGTSRETELGRYALVLHLRPALRGDGYRRRGLRVETPEQAEQIDAAIEHAWRGHPRRVFVEHTHDFQAKVHRVLMLIHAELECEHSVVGGATGARTGA
jgi:hypothetical protein